MHVYVITNTVNGKLYVGQHVGDDLNWYWNHNIRAALRGSGNKTFLYRAIRKYGPEIFTIESIANPIDKHSMDKLEIAFISTLMTQDPAIGYNITGGGGGRLGVSRPHTEEEKQKISKIMKGRKLSPEWKKKIGDSQRGKKLTDAHRVALSAGQTGKPKKERSSEHCAKIRENKRLWWALKKGTEYVPNKI